MDYTLAYIRNRVLDDKLDDTEFDPNIIDRFINDAQRSIFNSYELPFMEKVFQGVLPIGGYMFTFPEDYQMQQSLVIVGPDGQTKDITDNYVHFRQFNEHYPVPSTRQAGIPTTWTIHGGKLYLDRPTDKEYTLSLFYVKTPAKLTDDAHVPEIPESFSEVLVLGAYYRVLERNEDFDQAKFIKDNDYAEELNNMLNRLGKRQTGRTMVMGRPRHILRRR